MTVTILVHDNRRLTLGPEGTPDMAPCERCGETARLEISPKAGTPVRTLCVDCVGELVELGVQVKPVPDPRTYGPYGDEGAVPPGFGVHEVDQGDGTTRRVLFENPDPDDRR